VSAMPHPIHDIPFHYKAPHPSEPPADLVSIIIASYNYQDFIEATLDSVLIQTHKNLELVIVDDCSPDRSVEVITRWLMQHKDRFLRAILAKPHHNQGLAQTRNSAIRLACGAKIFVLDSDNMLLPSCIARHCEVMDRTGAELVYSIFEWFGAIKQPGVGDFWDPSKLRHGNYIDAMAMFSKTAWSEVGEYSYFDVMGWEDYDLWLKFIERGFTGIFIPEVLCRYRVHPASMNLQETGPKGLRLNVEMTARHPWLDLEPIR
jgi:glycosyltransferase involved in cell wall biosynthesis